MNESAAKDDVYVSMNPTKSDSKDATDEVSDGTLAAADASLPNAETDLTDLTAGLCCASLDGALPEKSEIKDLLKQRTGLQNRDATHARIRQASESECEVSVLPEEFQAYEEIDRDNQSSFSEECEGEYPYRSASAISAKDETGYIAAILNDDPTWRHSGAGMTKEQKRDRGMEMFQRFDKSLSQSKRSSSQRSLQSGNRPILRSSSLGTIRESFIERTSLKKKNTTQSNDHRFPCSRAGNQSFSGFWNRSLSRPSFDGIRRNRASSTSNMEEIYNRAGHDLLNQLIDQIKGMKSEMGRMRNTSRHCSPSINEESMPSPSSQHETRSTSAPGVLPVTPPVRYAEATAMGNRSNTHYEPIKQLQRPSLKASSTERRKMKFKLVGKDGVEEKFVELELPKSNGILYINF